MKRLTRQLVSASATLGLVVGFLAMFSATSWADHVGQSIVVGGMEVHLGIMAAEVLRKHPEQYPYHERGKIPSGKNMYHVLLALFDRSSGERITDADVEARISPLGLSGPKRRLEPMSVAGAITYCNYFRLSPTDTYVVRAEIRRPGVSRVTRAEFVLRPD